MRNKVFGFAIVLMLCMSGFVSAFSISNFLDSATNYLKMDSDEIEFNSAKEMTLNVAKLVVNNSVSIPTGSSYWIGNTEDSGARARLHLSGTNVYFDFGTDNLNFRTGDEIPDIKMVLTSAGNLGVGTTNPNEKLEVNGNIKATAFFYSSDERLKTNISTIEDPIEKIMQLEGVEFNWKSNGEKNLGFIAQDVEKVFPEVVSQNGEYKSVGYGNLVAPLLEAVKEQQNIIENLTNTVNELSQKIEELECN